VYVPAWDPASGRYAERPVPAENYDYRDRRALGRVTGTLGEAASLSAHARHFDGRMGYGVTDLGFFRTANDVETGTLAGGFALDAARDDDAVRAAFGFARQNRAVEGAQFAGTQGGLPVYTRGRSETEGMRWRPCMQGTRRLDERNRVTGGLEYERIEATFEPVRDAATGATLPGSAGRTARTGNVAVYVQDEASFGRLSLTGGARLDDHSEFGSVLSPRAGLAFRVSDQTRLRASAGRAYRAPSPLELFQPDVPFGNYVFQSNPELTPEYVTACDAGVEQRLPGEATLRVTGFYNDMDDLIGRRTEGSRITFANIAEAWSGGVEAELSASLSGALRSFVQGTVQRSEDRETGRDLAYTPEVFGAMGVEGLLWRGGPARLTASACESFVGSRGFVDDATGQWHSLSAYWRTDAGARLERGRWWVGAGARNLLDRDYQESSTLNPAPGRLWHVEAGWTL
jgi:outer membrane receptor protein involved in Fe transport